MLRFNPAFWWTLRPGASAVPRTDRVMPFTRRSSIPTQPWPDLNRTATGRPSPFTTTLKDGALRRKLVGRRTGGPHRGPPVAAARCRFGRDSEVHVAAAGRGGRRLLERGAGNLGRVDDPRLEQVDVLAGGRVEAMAGLHSTDPLDHHAALKAGVDGDLLQRLLERAAHDHRAGRLVTDQVDLVQRVLRPQQGHAAAGDDALLHRRAGVGVGVLDLGLDLVDAALDVVLAAGALDDGGLVLGDDHLAGTAQ